MLLCLVADVIDSVAGPAVVTLHPRLPDGRDRVHNEEVLDDVQARGTSLRSCNGELLLAQPHLINPRVYQDPSIYLVAYFDTAASRRVML